MEAKNKTYESPQVEVIGLQIEESILVLASGNAPEYEEEPWS